MPARMAFYDIEATNLSADFGYILCVCIWMSDWKKPKVISVLDFPKTFKRDPTDDSQVVQAAKVELERADIICGHYSTRFDLPFINSRLLAHGGSPVAPGPHIDTWRISRYRLKLHSNRLGSIAEFYGLEQKTPLKGPIWVKAMAGNRKAIKYINEHCYQDVIVLRQVYDKLKCIAPNPPNLNLVDPVERGCPRCGEPALQARGWGISRTRKYQRYQCKACGGWSTGPTVKTGVTIR